MLPPFVPPAARAATESLPLITEFVRQRVEQPSDRFWKSENQLSKVVESESAPHEVVSAAEVGAAPAAALPSITNFLAARPGETSYEAPAPSPSSRMWHRVPDDVAQLSDPETLPEPIEGIPVVNAIPIVNEYAPHMELYHAAGSHAEPADVETPPVETPSASQTAHTEAATQASSAASVDVPQTDAASSPSEDDATDTPAEALWIAEERNAFDWGSVAGLAARQNEERRAEDDWAATNWDQGTSEAEQVASLLNQVVRRVRAGELKVDASRGMSAESALAATLAALLRSED